MRKRNIVRAGGQHNSTFDLDPKSGVGLMLQNETGDEENAEDRLRILYTPVPNEC